jgi:hypothetical protein
MKRPTRLQYFFAQLWPARIWFTAGPVLALVIAVRACEPSVVFFADWRRLLLFLVTAVLAPVIGFLAALPVWFLIFPPIYYIRGLANGAPFNEGDVVQILVGPHRGKITTVYSTFSRCEGRFVRVILGPQDEETSEDVFSPSQLLREDHDDDTLVAVKRVPQEESDKEEEA